MKEPRQSLSPSESIMSLAELVKIPPFVCRFEAASPGGKVGDSYRDFCAFEFPGCSGCPLASHTLARVATTEDPLKVWGQLPASSKPRTERRKSTASTQL